MMFINLLTHIYLNILDVHQCLGMFMYIVYSIIYVNKYMYIYILFVHFYIHRWMKKWPFNNSLGSATRRYFILEKDSITYFKVPPTQYESSVYTPYILRKPYSEQLAGNGNGNDKLKSLHISAHTRVNKTKVQLMYNCMSIRYVLYVCVIYIVYVNIVNVYVIVW